MAGHVPVGIAAYSADRRAYRRVKWITPAWAWVDPLKDRQAEEIAVRNGWKSRSDVIEAEGRDPEENDARIKQDRDREERLGLDFSPSATQGEQASNVSAEDGLPETLQQVDK